MSSASQGRSIPAAGFLCGTQTQRCGGHPELPVPLWGTPQSSQGINPTWEGLFSSLLATQQIISGIQPNPGFVDLGGLSQPPTIPRNQSLDIFTPHQHPPNPPPGRFLVFQEGLFAGQGARMSLPAAQVLPGLTPLPAPAGDEHGDDEEHEEEQQGGQDVAQLLEKVQPALRDDDVDDIVAPDHVGI